MNSPCDKSKTVKHVALLFSLGFLTTSLIACLIEHDYSVFSELVTILSSPSPLVTDYFVLGSLSSAFLNTAICGLFWTFILFILDDNQHTETEFAGYFLVVAHCFYGLNFFNMMIPVIGILVFCKATGKKFKDNIDKAMLSTAFGPFIGELCFRYHTLLVFEVTIGSFSINLIGLFFALLLGIFLGFVIPPMLIGAKALHKDYDLYNGGLAFGLLGLLISSFMYKSMGKEPFVSVTKNMFKPNYIAFCNCFFVSMFAICIIIGFLQNNKSFKGYGKLLNDSGYKVEFIEKYGSSFTWMNLGFYGLMMTFYFNLVTCCLDGVGWTGATCGVTLAAMSFAAAGQHPKNVWPILAGFVIFEIFTLGICFASGLEKCWNLSSQEYINAVAFATGLCPFAGKFGRKTGIIAGFMCAVMCTSTSSIHCGLVLYNGGFTAGITAMLLCPLVEYYNKKNN